MPVLTIVAGPNGAGKSTLIRDYKLEGKQNLLDTDAIAKRMNPENPMAAAVAAGREVIGRTRDFIATHQSFVLETTFSGNISLSVINSAKAEGFEVNLLYVYLKDSEIAVERVQERVTKGGHFVPADDVKRRYGRSLENLKIALGLVDHAMIFNNTSTLSARLVLETKGRTVTRHQAELPPALESRVANLA
jgi:predicted ABC-type ATPase